MLRRWLAPQPLDEFLVSHFGKGPFARPGAAADVLTWFDWPVLDALLSARGPRPDVLVANEGRLVDVPAPRGLPGVRRVMGAEHGVVIRKAERHDARLAELARAIGEDLPGRVHVQIYATPAGTQTFGWHFDTEDVFIVQARGAKDYYMRANTVATGPAEACADFGIVRQETSPLMVARLLPGDWLYIPASWWHLVRSVEDALSISVGVLTDVALRAPARSESSGGAGARRPGEHVQAPGPLRPPRSEPA